MRISPITTRTSAIATTAPASRARAGAAVAIAPVAAAHNHNNHNQHHNPDNAPRGRPLYGTAPFITQILGTTITNGENPQHFMRSAASQYDRQQASLANQPVWFDTAI